MATGSTERAPRKVRVRKAFRTDDFSPEGAWQELSKNLKDVLNHNVSHLSFEDNYRLAYRLVLYKSGDLLYNGAKKLIIEKLEYLANNVVIPAFPSTTDDPVKQRDEEVLLLRALREAWDYHATNMRFLGDILGYMDRMYVRSADLPPIKVMGSQLFVEHIIDKPSIKAQVIIAISNQLQRELDGYAVNRSAIEECVDIFLKVEASRGVNAFGLGTTASVQLPEGGAGPGAYDTAEILRLIRRACFTDAVSSTDHAGEDDTLSFSYPTSEYSLAPSLTETTDYGIYARRMALSQATVESDLSDES